MRHGSRAPLALVAISLAGLAACGPEQPADCPKIEPPKPIASASAAPPVTAAASATTAPAASGYSGHGLDSVSREQLAEFAPAPLPPETSARIQALLDVRAPGAGRLSPDGKTLYFSWTISGTRQIWRLDGPKQFPVQMTGGEDPTTIADLTPDGKWLILSRDRAGEENPGLYLQAPKGGPLTVIQHKPKVQTSFLFVSDDSRYVYFRSNDVKVESYIVYRYDLQTKQREVVFDQEGIWSVSDFKKDGRLLLAKEVGSNMAEYFEYDPGKKVLTPLFGQGEREDYVAEYGAGEGEVLVQTPKIGEFRRLYLWKGGKLTAVSPELKHDVESFATDRPKDRIVYGVNEGGYTRLRAMDGKTFKELKLPAFPSADHVSAVATTPDGKYTTFGIDTGNGPPHSYSVEWKTGKLTEWHVPSSPEIDATTFARASLESYPARDGTPIPMFVRRPASCNKPCPVVVDFHGGPEGQAMAGFSVWAQGFVNAGFVYVTPNVRGSDGYGKTWLHADDGPKRLNVITDIEDCAKYIRKAWAEGGKEPKVGITGGSYGGYSTLIGMSMFAGAYDAGAENVGFSSLITFLKNTAPYRRPLRISEYGDPDKDKDALEKLSPITYLDKIKAPMLLIQGANDPRVPVGEAIQIYRAMEAKKLPAKLMIFADEGHGAQKRGNVALTLGHMVRFFEQHLK
ncbi:MAG: prolyl oligopeptidase family serine peptidase [Byssovorax sp.]